MTLLELLTAVKEQTLSREELEKYRDQLCSLFADMNIELAGIEKAEAIFFYDRTNPETSDISIKRAWRASDLGQRGIVLNRYIKATSKVIDSLKGRIYATIM